MSEPKAGTAWTEAENDVIVASYFRMLRAELRGEPYVKSAENRRVQEGTGRSRGSVEHKFMNISAALLELGLVHIDGYKPERNSQAALRVAVAEYAEREPGLLDLMDAFVRREEPAGTSDFAWDVQPSAVPSVEFLGGHRGEDFRPLHIDFVAREAANRSLGLAGEVAVVESERRLLRTAGRDDLAGAVEHVARTRGDGAGFDVLSFDAATEEERYIEVKTTRRSEYSPFYVSRNEVAFSRARTGQFALYRLFRFGRRSRGFYVLQGALDTSCVLDPIHYSARPKVS